MRVTVLGGGVLGASTCYHLAKLGARVTSVSGSAGASAATSRSAGLILHYGASFKMQAARSTLADIADLESALEEDLGFVECGSLRVAVSSQRCQDLEREAAQIRDRGFSSVKQQLDHAELGARVPWLQLPSSATATLVERDGYIDPVVLTGAYWRRARELGAVGIADDASELVPSDDGRSVAAIRLRGARDVVESDHVVDATGLWSGRLAELAFGVEALPMAPVRSHYWIATSANDNGLVDPLAVTPMVLLPDAGAYTRPAAGSGLLIGLQEQRSATWNRNALFGKEKDREASSSSTALDLEIAHEAAAADADDALHLVTEALFPEEEKEEEGDDGQSCSRRSLAHFLTPDFIARLALPHYAAGLTTYTPDGQYLVGCMAGDASPSNYTVLSGCNGSGISSAGGLGSLAARCALGLQEEEEEGDTSPTRSTLQNLPAVGSEEFQRLCSNARASKFQTK